MMKNIKNILGMGAFMLLASLAVSSCTEKSDWDIDSSYSRPFGTDENGISVETDSKVARAVVTWSSTSNTDYYIIEISPNEMTDETPMGSEEKLREKAKNLETMIEPRLLQAFKRIRKNSRNGLGITYVQRDACGGCFNNIPPQRQLDIRMRKKIIVCEYCGRIMIDPELAGVVAEKQLETKIKTK
jgi:RNase P subunit RPR2